MDEKDRGSRQTEILSFFNGNSEKIARKGPSFKMVKITQINDEEKENVDFRAVNGINIGLSFLIYLFRDFRTFNNKESRAILFF